MIKAVIFGLLLLFTLNAVGQTTYYDQIKYQFDRPPFDFRNLEQTSAISLFNDSIKPFFNEGEFYYQNTGSKKIFFKNGFEEAYPFCKGYAIVKVHDKYGVIDRTAKFVVQPEYTDFYLNDYSSEITFFRGSQKRTFDYNTGELSDYIYSEILPRFYQNTVYKKHGKYGVIFENGKKLSAKYDSILSTSYRTEIVVQKNGKIGVVNEDGKLIQPLTFKEFYGGYPWYALKKGTNWYYFGKIRFVSKNQPVFWRYSKLIFKANNHYGCMDEEGHEILPANYQWISEEGPVAINKNNQLVFWQSGEKDFVYYTLTPKPSQ